MEVEPSCLFQLEDGDSLSIAVHSDVPQYDLFCAIIREHRGFVVEDASAADFCILSSISPSADGIAEELRLEGRLAIYDHWIRDSVNARHLLSWYPYQACPQSNRSSVVPSQEAVETHKRDMHELIVTSARYWPLLPEKELYRYVSRKCPHRSATSFRHLYESNRLQMDSRVSYLRRRLEGALAFNNEFNQKPKMTFASPNKHNLLQIEDPSSSGGAPLPTPTSVSGTGHGHSAMSHSGGHHSVASASHHEIPYEPPNVDTPSSPPPLPNAASSSSTPDIIKEIARTTSPERVNKTASRAPKTAIPGKRTYGSSGIPATYEDKFSLAKFLAENPRGELGIRPYFELFRRQNDRARLRTANAWVHLWRTYNAQILEMEREIRKKRKNRTSYDSDHDSTSSARPSPIRALPVTKSKAGPPSNSRTKPHVQAKPSASFSLRSPIYETKKRIPITDEDKQLLAQWMVDNPKGPDLNNRQYFELFERQYKGPVRRQGAWEAASYGYKADIAERQRKILLQRGKASGSGSKRPMSSRSGIASVANMLGVKGRSTKNREKVDDAVHDSDLSSIDSGSDFDG